MFKFNCLDIIKDEVDIILIKERENFNYYYDLIEKFAIENDMLLGGFLGINLITNKEKNIDDFIYKLYTFNTFKKTADLVQHLNNNVKSSFPPITFTFHTNIPKYKFLIKINNRIICEICYINEQHFKNINYMIKKSRLNNSIYIIPPEMYLFDIYRIIYSPSKADDWLKYAEYEHQLFEYLKQRKTKITGSDEKYNEKKIDYNEKIKIIYELIDNFVKYNNIVLIGEYTEHVYIENKANILQVISENDINDDFIIIKKFFNENYPNYTIELISKNLQVMSDFRLMRHIIKVNDKEILYIYNSAQYDLIPYNLENDIKVGTVPVVLRYLLFDLWIISISNNIDETYAKAKKENILNSFIKFRSITNNIILTDTEYLGTYLDDVIAEKITKNIHK